MVDKVHLLTSKSYLVLRRSDKKYYKSKIADDTRSKTSQK